MTLSLKTVLADARLSQAALKAVWHKQPRIPVGMKGAGRWHNKPTSTAEMDQSAQNASWGLQYAPVAGLKSDGATAQKMTWVTIRKTDSRKGIVEGLVYEPNVLDSQGEFMTADDLETMAHRFMSLNLGEAIDTNHSMAANGCYPVESFIARKGDPDYPEGGWVIAVKCTDAMLAKIDSGEINGFSFAAIVSPTLVDVEYYTLRDHVGLTVKTDDHEHVYFVQMDDNGRIKGGYTDEVNGHTHLVVRGSTTEVAMGHSHRYFLE